MFCDDWAAFSSSELDVLAHFHMHDHWERQTPSTTWTKPVYYGLFIIENSALYGGYFCAGRVCRCGNTNARMLFLHAGEKALRGATHQLTRGRSFWVLGQLLVTNDFHHRCSEPASSSGPPLRPCNCFSFFVMREVAAAVPCEIQRGGSVSVSRVFMSLFSFSGCSVALEPLGFNWWAAG